jgi:peptide chain release factor 2
MKEMRILEKKVNAFYILQNRVDDVELEFELWKEEMSTEDTVDGIYKQALDQLEEIEFKAMLSKQEDELNCILEINAGAGGTEANDWSQMLLRMYEMWADKQGFKHSILERTDGDVAGIKSVSMEIVGEYAFGMLKGENGVHRLVRVSPFNSQGKRMTSFSSVFVHPMIDDRIEIDINPADLEWDTYRASGAGGQHVNKTESAVRCRHLPSGFVVTCQEDRSQHMNRAKAIQMLKSKLYEAELQRQFEERDKIEATKMKNEWGSQIRSYVLDDRRVKDHRSNFSTNNTDSVLDGNIDGFLRAYLLSGGKLVVEEE